MLPSSTSSGVITGLGAQPTSTVYKYCSPVCNGYTSFFRSWRIAVENSEVLLLVSMYSTLSVPKYIHLGLLEGTFCVVPAHKEHCVLCVYVYVHVGEIPPCSRTENYRECDEISVGVTETKPHLLVDMCMEWKSLSPGVSRP